MDLLQEIPSSVTPATFISKHRAGPGRSSCSCVMLLALVISEGALCTMWRGSQCEARATWDIARVMIACERVWHTTKTNANYK